MHWAARHHRTHILLKPKETDIRLQRASDLRTKLVFQWPAPRQQQPRMRRFAHDIREHLQQHRQSLVPGQAADGREIKMLDRQPEELLCVPAVTRMKVAQIHPAAHRGHPVIAEALRQHVPAQGFTHRHQVIGKQESPFLMERMHRDEHAQPARRAPRQKGTMAGLSWIFTRWGWKRRSAPATCQLTRGSISPPMVMAVKGKPRSRRVSNTGDCAERMKLTAVPRARNSSLTEDITLNAAKIAIPQCLRHLECPVRVVLHKRVSIRIPARR